MYTVNQSSEIRHSCIILKRYATEEMYTSKQIYSYRSMSFVF